MVVRVRIFQIQRPADAEQTAENRLREWDVLPWESIPELGTECTSIRIANAFTLDLRFATQTIWSLHRIENGESSRLTGGEFTRGDYALNYCDAHSKISLPSLTGTFTDEKGWTYGVTGTLGIERAVIHWVQCEDTAMQIGRACEVGRILTAVGIEGKHPLDSQVGAIEQYMPGLFIVVAQKNSAGLELASQLKDRVPCLIVGDRDIGGNAPDKIPVIGPDQIAAITQLVRHGYCRKPPSPTHYSPKQ